jgi:hypothetical protein
MSKLKALWSRVSGNKVTTGGVLVTLVVAVGSVFGFDVSVEVASTIALGITSFIGLFAKD